MREVYISMADRFYKRRSFSSTAYILIINLSDLETLFSL